MFFISDSQFPEILYLLLTARSCQVDGSSLLTVPLACVQKDSCNFLNVNMLSFEVVSIEMRLIWDKIIGKYRVTLKSCLSCSNIDPTYCITDLLNDAVSLYLKQSPMAEQPVKTTLAAKCEDTY